MSEPGLFPFQNQFSPPLFRQRFGIVSADEGSLRVCVDGFILTTSEQVLCQADVWLGHLVNIALNKKKMAYH